MFRTLARRFLRRIARLADRRNLIGIDHLHVKVLTVRDVSALKQAMHWRKDPVLEEPEVYQYRFLTDLNDRRRVDAMFIGCACANSNPSILLEIGTGHGYTTALMARNAPGGIVYTVNIPPDEIKQGGVYTTFAPEISEIGKYYRTQELYNIRQIYANTKPREPDFAPIDLAFIDGSHDSDFVYSDTLKVLRRARPGSLILWHDFAPGMAKIYPWIGQVCEGVSRLYAAGHLTDPILHLQDSWVGLYVVPGDKTAVTSSTERASG